MKLYIVQHAKAVSTEYDPQRPLSPEGVEDVEKVSMVLESMDISVGYLWHSKKLRAVQTAGFLSQVITINEEKAGIEGLLPGDDVNDMIEKIKSVSQDVMIVGHMPFVSRLLSMLVTGSENVEVAEFQNGGMICLEETDQNFKILWMIVPKLFD